jgi:hypothetical protein
MSKQDKVIEVVIDFGSSDELLFARFAIDEYGKFIDVNITYQKEEH